MVFWVGILVGATFAWFAVKMGFYETWAFAFNIVISVYLAIYLRPIIADTIPVAGDTAYSNVLTMAVTAIGTFLILHGISYTLFTGQFSISFPKVFDTLGAAFLGFLAGLLVWSFVSFLICIAPISQRPIVKEIGFGSQIEQTNISYLSWWCDLVNMVVSRRDDEHATKEVIGELRESVELKVRAELTPDEPNEPNNVGTSISEESQPGPPPEIDYW